MKNHDSGRLSKGSPKVTLDYSMGVCHGKMSGNSNKKDNKMIKVRNIKRQKKKGP